MDGSTSGASICNSVVLKFRDLKTDSLGFFHGRTFNFQTKILPKSIACGFPSVDHILILAISCCALWLHSRRWQSINFLSQPKIAQSPGRSGHKIVQKSKDIFCVNGQQLKAV